MEIHWLIPAGRALLSIGLLSTLPAQAATRTDSADNEIRILNHASLAVTDSEKPPPTGSPLWQEVTLTDIWPIERYDQGRQGWYRIPLELASVPSKSLGILLRRTNMNAEIHLNGELILTGGSFEEPLSRNWNRPLYSVPSLALWRQGHNDLFIRHISYPGYGYVSPLYLGPDEILGPEYRRLFLMQVEIAQYLFPVTVALSLFMLSIWLSLPGEKAYLFFALAIGFWSVYIMNMFTKDLVVSTRLWEWIAHITVDGWVICFAVFMHTFAGISLRVRGWFYASFIATAALTYAVVDLATLKIAVRYFHGASIAIGGSVVVTMVRHWWLCDRSTTLGILNLCLIVLLATGVHDWMFQTGLVGVTGPVSLHLHYYSAPLIFAFITWHLTARFATTMTDLSRLNRELESRVTAAELSLQERYEEIHSMEQQQAVMAERERLAREIHDGVGGNFSNAIMLTELIGRDGNPARVSSLMKLLQDGLADVRQLITTMSGDLSSVESLIRYVTDKADNVLSAAGVSLESTSNNVSQFRSLTQSESLNLVRIFQEAVNNVLKHARASKVLFHCEGYPDGIRIIITDDGVGFSDISETGYGLNNIRRRCLEIAATCRIQGKAGSGSQITIALND